MTTSPPRPQAEHAPSAARASASGKGPAVGDQATLVFGATPGSLGRLVVEEGAHAGEEVLLGAGSCVIGRSSSCALVLRRSAGISRRHAKVTQVEGDYFVEDLESRNGTRVNGELIAGRARLRDGDVIGISGDLIRFHSPAPAEAADPERAPRASPPTNSPALPDDTKPRSALRQADEQTAPVPDASPYVHGHRPARAMSVGTWVGVLMGGILTACLVVLADLVAFDGALVDSLTSSDDVPPPSHGASAPEVPPRTGLPAGGLRPTPAGQPPDGSSRALSADSGTPADVRAANEDAPSQGLPDAGKVPGRLIVRTPAAATIERVYIRVGESVRAGQPLVSLSRASPGLARKRQALLREEASFAPLAAAGNARAAQDLEAVRKELRALDLDTKATLLRAEASGRVVTVYVQRGTRVQRGEELVVLARTDDARATSGGSAGTP